MKRHFIRIEFELASEDESGLAKERLERAQRAIRHQVKAIIEMIEEPANLKFDSIKIATVDYNGNVTYDSE